MPKHPSINSCLRYNQNQSTDGYCMVSMRMSNGTRFRYCRYFAQTDHSSGKNGTDP
jgi:hypothetical protein